MGINAEYMGRQVKLSLSSQDVFSVSLSLGESQIQSSKMMSLNIVPGGFTGLRSRSHRET